MKYCIDIGSSTIKVYKNEEEKFNLLEKQSIHFKEYFSEEEGISRKNYRELMIYIKQMVQKYELSNENCNIYATGIWRKISNEQFEMLRADFSEIGLIFNVILQEAETMYFENGIREIYNSSKALMVNIIGKTTELIVSDKGNVILKKNLKIGVTEILNNFPEINAENCKVKIEDILNYVLEVLKDEKMNFNCDLGIFIGGEFKTKKIVKYNLVPNGIFHDGIHEYLISYKDFESKNKELLEKISLADLYLLMESNKKWLEGAKASSILAQAIFKKAKVKYVIPADLKVVGM